MMKNNATSTSPFAALNSKEQMERWACWHSQKITLEPTAQKPESVLNAAKPTVSRNVYQPHHSQYDAVVRRMQKATRQAVHYSNCNSCEMTRQD